MNKRLIVCGDSFHSICSRMVEKNGNEISLLGTHYSEILANGIGFDLINLAAAGSSISVVALQILEAIDLEADLIIVGQTYANRIIYQRSHVEFDHYTASWNLGHIYYPQRIHPYKGLGKEYTEHVVTVPIHNIELDDLRNILLKYYPFEIQSKIDMIAFTHAIRELADSKIKFLLWCPNVPVTRVRENEFHPFYKYCSKENLITVDQFDLVSYQTPEAPQYHTSMEVQVLVAEYLEKRLREQSYV